MSLSYDKDEEEVCALCGCIDNNKKTDHLRECYKISAVLLDKSMYKPLLFEDEMKMLQGGLNTICNNRKKCRARQRRTYSAYLNPPNHGTYHSPE